MTTFSTRNSLPLDVRKKSIDLLNQALADLIDLQSQTKQAHWNVKGMQFIALHELFDMLSASLIAHIDTVAERATALGGSVSGTVRMAAASSELPEFPSVTDGKSVVEAVSDRFSIAGAGVRAAIDAASKDADTVDVFTEISRDLDKLLWFLEAHLQ